MTYKSNLLPRLRDINVGQGMNEILPGLYVGNLRDSKDSRQLDIHKITHILSIHDDDARKPFKEKKYLIISAADSPKQDLSQYISQTNDFIHAARFRGGHVLIHCVAGISRSVTIAAAYIMSVTNINHQEAFQVVRSARNAANPNIGFQRQLYEFEMSGACEKEQERLYAKFHPYSVTTASNSARKNGAKNRPSSATGILKKPSNKTGTPCNPSSFPGRLTLKSAFTSNCAQDDLSVNDREKCIVLLENYRQQVLKGDMCAGDCKNDGISCATGVCRAHLRSTSWSLLRRNSTIRRPSSMFASTNENFWSIWSIDTEDQIRQSLTHASDRDFHGCTGSPFKRPHSAPIKQKSVMPSDRNPTVISSARMQTSQPFPILKKSLVKVKSDSSLPTTPQLGNDIRRHQMSFSASPARQRFLKVPTMSNLLEPSQSGITYSGIKDRATCASNEELPISMSLQIQENTHSLKRHVSWSDTTTQSNLNYEVVMPNIQCKEPPDIRIELDNQSSQR